MNLGRSACYAAVAIVATLASGCQSSVREAAPWNDVFEKRAGQGWNGGDGAYSVSLPAGRTLWLFGDSVLGSVKDGRRTDLDYRFGNTIAVQETPRAGQDPSSASIQFDWAEPSSTGWLPVFEETLEAAAIPESLARARASGRHTVAWPQHGAVVGRDLVLFNAVTTLGGCDDCLFNFEVHGSIASVITGVDRPYEQWGFRSGIGWAEDSRPRQRFVEPGLPSGNGVSLLFGTYVVVDPEQPSALLVYGHRTEGARGALVVARVSPVRQAADVMDYGRWSYWDGQRWAAEPAAARGILAGSAVDVSVSKVPESAGSGWAVVHGGALDAAVHVALGASPVGPFTESYVMKLSDCPIQGFDRTRPPIAYATKAHPELSTEDELLISLVLIETAVEGPQRGSGYYVPRFLHLPWEEILDHRQSSPERCDATSD
jgi:hypothetical protein